MNKNITRSLLFAAIVFGSFSCSKNETVDATPIKQNVLTHYDYAANETELVSLINDYRVSQGLNILILDNYVTKVAENHDIYMIGKDAISHDFFNQRFQDIVANANGKKVAENVAYKFNNAQSVLNAWINSPEHKLNLLGDFTHFGISIKTNANGVLFYTNIFTKK